MAFSVFAAGWSLRSTGKNASQYANQIVQRETITTGWRPSCACVDESDHNGPFEPVPQTVLEPFNGSSTTGAVAVMHVRNYIGIELNPAYVELSQKRINCVQMEAAL